MGALANASALRHDPTFTEWVETAAAYQARLVITEDADTPDHDIRLRLARDAAVTPGVAAGLLVTIVATDPEVATKGETADAVGEALIIAKVAGAWTVLSHLIYPNG